MIVNIDNPHQLNEILSEYTSFHELHKALLGRITAAKSKQRKYKQNEEEILEKMSKVISSASGNSSLSADLTTSYLLCRRDLELAQSRKDENLLLGQVISERDELASVSSALSKHIENERKVHDDLKKKFSESKEKLQSIQGNNFLYKVRKALSVLRSFHASATARSNAYKTCKMNQLQ